MRAGASVAVLVFPYVGPIGMVALRLMFSALVLLAGAGVGAVQTAKDAGGASLNETAMPPAPT